MVEPSAVRAIANSQVGTTVAKQLWPTMLFLVCMSLISLFGGKWWSSSLDPVSITLSYWLWFAAMLIITAYGVFVFFLDARINLTRSQPEN